MTFQFIDWKKVIVLGVIAGVIWGWVALCINAISGIFRFEDSLLHNLVSFSAGGAVFGIVVSGFLSLLQERLPFRNIFLKSGFVSAIIWLILEVGGAMLSSVEPDRYHPITAQFIQGLVLSIIMGCILGALWKIKGKEA